jgi:hypothetical protein
MSYLTRNKGNAKKNTGGYKPLLSCTRISNEKIAVMLKRIPADEGEMLVPEFDNDGGLVGKSPGPRKYPEDPILVGVGWQTDYVSNREEHFRAEVIDAGSSDIEDTDVEVKAIYSLMLAIDKAFNDGLDPFEVPVTMTKTGTMKSTRVVLHAYSP